VAPTPAGTIRTWTRNARRERLAVAASRSTRPAGRGDRLRARPLPAQLLTLEKRGDVWEEAPLASKRLPPPSLRPLGQRRPPTHCAPRVTNGDTAAYPPVQLRANAPGVSVSAVLALARRAPARAVTPYPGETTHAPGRRYRTKWFELCTSARAKATDGAGIDTVVALLSAANQHDAGELLRGQAIVRDSGRLSGGQGPSQVPPADFERHLPNQVGLFELPLKARPPAFLVAVAVGYDP
jgi:hypothetical protein